MLGATALAFYALLGFEDSVNLAEETQKPRRDFPRALFGGLAIAGVIYLGVAFTTSMLVDTETLAESTGPLLEVVKVAGLTFPPGLFAVIALLAVTNTALINMIMASRLVYGMSNEGIVPKVLGRVHQGRQTPYVAIAFTAAHRADPGEHRRPGGPRRHHGAAPAAGVRVVNISVLVLRKEPDDEPAEGDDGPSFRAPTWVPVVGAVVSLVLASPLTGRDADVYLRAGILLGVGVVLYVINRLVVGRSSRQS